MRTTITRVSIHRFTGSILFLLLFQSLFATNYEANSLSGFEQNANKASPGDTISLSPGNYSGSITLDKSYPAEVVFRLNGVNLNGGAERYTLDLKGKHITLLLSGSEIRGGKEAGIAQRGDHIKVIGENTLITGNKFGLLLVGTNHHTEGLTFRGQTTTGIAGNNLKLDPLTRNFAQGFYRGPDNNWRITRCRFFDIAPLSPGNAGGAIRLIPHVRGVIIDNCYFQDIVANAVWFDHYDDDLGIYYNTFKNVEYKCIFLEISDPNPAKPVKGAKIAGNISYGNQRHGAFVSASNDVEIWANRFEGWPVVLHGMPRDFERRYNPKDRTTWENVDATLKNNYVHHNLLIPTKGRNHVMIWDGVKYGNRIESNYYVTGFVSGFNQTPINDAHFSTSDGKNLHWIDEYGLTKIDPAGQKGLEPSEFPYPEVFAGIPVQRYARSDTGLVDPPDTTTHPPDTTNNPPAPNPQRPSVWIVSDLSAERTDKDDRVSSVMALSSLDYVNLKGWTVGAHKWNLPNALSWFNQNLSYAYQKERAALHAQYGGFPEVLPMHQASTTGKGYRPGLTSLDEYPSVKALYEAAQQGTLYILLWGPGGEVATMLDYASRQSDQSAFLNTIVITHASSPKSLNNCARDVAACAYLHDLAREGKLKLYELGFAGKVIDDKTFPKIGTEVLKSKIGKYLEEKWQNEKPDGSDAISFFVLVEKLGGGLDYLETLQSDGSSNMAKVMGDFSKQVIYDHLQERFKVAASGKTDTTPKPSKSKEEKMQDFLENLRDQIDNFLEEMKKD